jgi:hypothetical protein
MYIATRSSIYLYTRSSWIKIDSLQHIVRPSSYVQFTGLWVCGVTNLFVYGIAGEGFPRGFLYHSDGVNWHEEVYRDSSLYEHPGYNSAPLYCVRGRNQKDIFAVGRFVHHFNGKTWKTYSTLYDGDALFDIWLGKEEVFIAGKDHQQGLIIRGK